MQSAPNITNVAIIYDHVFEKGYFLDKVKSPRDFVACCMLLSVLALSSVLSFSFYHDIQEAREISLSHQEEGIKISTDETK